MQIHPDARRSVLVDLLTVYGAGGKAIVFANTKRDADEVSAAIANSMPTEVRTLWCFADRIAAQDMGNGAWHQPCAGMSDAASIYSSIRRRSLCCVDPLCISCFIHKMGRMLNLVASARPQALHGDIAQSSRERVLQRFRDGKTLCLVATDVAARGLDIPNVDLVVHYELPNVRWAARA